MGREYVVQSHNLAEDLNTLHVNANMDVRTDNSLIDLKYLPSQSPTIQTFSQPQRPHLGHSSLTLPIRNTHLSQSTRLLSSPNFTLRDINSSPLPPPET